MANEDSIREAIEAITSACYGPLDSALFHLDLAELPAEEGEVADLRSSLLRIAGRLDGR